MKVLCAAAALAAMAFPLAAQQKQMAPKSQKELEAIQAVMNATTPDAKMAAVDKLIADYKTDFKGWALDQAAEAARIKRDTVKAQFYANAEQWRKLPESERAVWRRVVVEFPPLPPGAGLPPLPPGMPALPR